MLKKLETIETKSVFKNPWWEYRLDEYKMPSGNIGKYHYVYTRGSTFVIPVLPGEKFVLTRQFRYLVQKESIEFPGGGLAEGLTPEENAKNELREEAGYTAEFLKYIGSFNPYNGVTTEMCCVFEAAGLKKRSEQPEESEEFEVFTLTKEEIHEKIKRGELWDGMTLAAWSIYLNS